QRMSDEEVAYWCDTFKAVNAISNYGQFAHVALAMAAQVAEQLVQDYPVSEEFHADLTGYSQAVAEDQQIASCLNEIVRENEEDIGEMMCPEYRLGFLLLGNAHKTMMVNNRRRLK